MLTEAEILRISTRLIFRLAEDDNSKKLNENDWDEEGPSDDPSKPVDEGYKIWVNKKDGEKRIQIHRPGSAADTKEKEVKKDPQTPEPTVTPETIHERIKNKDGYEGERDAQGRNIGIHQKDNDDGSVAVRIYDDNGNMESEGRVNNGALDGQQKWFHGDGKLKYEGTYIDGLAEGIHSQYDETGFLVNEVKYFDGKLHGKSTKYNEDGSHQGVFYDQGTKVFEGNYGKNNKLTGDAKWYNPDGSLAFTCRYKNGLMDGLATWYNEKGEVVAEATFKDGENIRTGLNSKNKEVDITEKMDDDVKEVHDILSGYINENWNENVPVDMAKNLSKVIKLKKFKDTSVTLVRENLKKYFNSKGMGEYDEFLNRVSDGDLRDIIEKLMVKPIEKISPAEFEEELNPPESKALADNGENTMSPMEQSGNSPAENPDDPDKDPRYVSALNKWKEAQTAYESGVTHGASSDILQQLFTEKEKAEKEATAVYDQIMKEMVPTPVQDKPQVDPKVDLPSTDGKTLTDPQEGTIDFGDESKEAIDGGKQKQETITTPPDQNMPPTPIQTNPQEDKELPHQKIKYDHLPEEKRKKVDELKNKADTELEPYIKSLRKLKIDRNKEAASPKIDKGLFHIDRRISEEEFAIDFISRKYAHEMNEEINREESASPALSQNTKEQTPSKSPTTPSGVPSRHDSENKKMVHHRNEFGNLPHQRREKINIIRNRTDASISPKRFRLENLKAKRSMAAPSEWASIDQQIYQVNSEIKGLSMSAAAEIRKEVQGDLLVTVPGGLTDKELESKIQDLRKFSSGTDVVFTGKDGKKQTGKIISNIWGGKFKVSYDNGEITLSGDEISHAVPVEDRIQESRKIHERREGINRDKNIEEDLKAIDGSPSPLHAKEMMKKMWDTDEGNLPTQIQEKLKQKEQNPEQRDFSQTPPGKNTEQNKKVDNELKEIHGKKLERYRVLLNKENKTPEERQEAASLYEDITTIDNLLKENPTNANNKSDTRSVEQLKDRLKQLEDMRYSAAMEGDASPSYTREIKEEIDEVTEKIKDASRDISTNRKSSTNKNLNKKNSRRASVKNDIYNDLAMYLIAERIN